MPSGYENISWWERVGQAESVEKSWKTWKLAKFWKITTLINAYKNFGNLHVFHDFSSDFACSTHPQQLLFSQPGDPSSWKTGGGWSNLYQTWFYMTTTKHGFSLNSGFTKILEFEIATNCLNQIFNLNTFFFFLFTGATWYYHTICLVITYFASFTDYADDIFEVISNWHIQGSKFGGKNLHIWQKF